MSALFQGRVPGRWRSARRFRFVYRCWRHFHHRHVHPWRQETQRRKLIQATSLHVYMGNITNKSRNSSKYTRILILL